MVSFAADKRLDRRGEATILAGSSLLSGEGSGEMPTTGTTRFCATGGGARFGAYKDCKSPFSACCSRALILLITKLMIWVKTYLERSVQILKHFNL